MALKTIQYKHHTFNISYEVLNPNGKLTIIFLHGWGSNKELMKQAFGTHLDAFRHIYIDLPGFGNSTCSVQLDTEDYANIMELFLAQINANQDPIILGHSFGGKVALLLKPSTLILVASAGIYLPKPLGVKLKIAFYKLLKLFGLSFLRSRFVADDAKALCEHMYQTFKTVVNEDFSKQFAAYSGRALLCWGKEDTATPIESARQIDGLIPSSRLVEFEGDHYFFMKQADAVCKEIESTVLEGLKH
ncbi:MAG: alpha/beta hydrolase [Campylobacterota bacterium]|nr:alpha/beta hydrolase [Campylobacterota bacterium]